MLTFSLQSGSNGNSVYVEAGDVHLLFDIGISARTAEGRMRVHGRDLSQVDAIVVSHEHTHPVRGVGIVHRRHHLPVHLTRRTHRALPAEVGALTTPTYFTAGERLWLNGVVVHTLRTPHDAVESVAFIVEHGGKRLGILTDLGHPFPALRRLLETLDAAYLESNYDPQMLAAGPYPARLQARIRGRRGHLSNVESAELVRSSGKKLKWVALAHLSAQNNRPELALETHRKHVGRTLPLRVSPREGVSDVWEV